MDRPTSYEFSEAQNLVFKTLSMRMRLFGVVVLLEGLLLLAGAAFLHLKLDQPFALVAILALSGVYLIVLGGPKLGVASSFNSILETSRNDIDHLMKALSGLQTAFLINCLIVVLVFVATVYVPLYTP
jgi:hypothetical protein